MKTMKLLETSKVKIAVIAAVVVLLLIAGTVTGVISANQRRIKEAQAATEAPTEPKPETHSIDGVEATSQDTLMAGCETHACCSLLNSLGYDIDVYSFAENYLECRYVHEDEATGITYGPDMNSAFAGTAYAGWGVYAPAMAKFMNHYLSDMKSDKKAYVVENKTLEQLCDEYIDNDIPVMIWATSDMQEPIERDVWEVDFVDENAKHKIGDRFIWMIHEHCLVLCGYDKNDYFFSDSVAAAISHFEKKISQKRYEQLGWQAIVVK